MSGEEPGFAGASSRFESPDAIGLLQGQTDIVETGEQCRVRVTGRLQSREYQKLLENGEYITRNAFEVSCFTLEAESAGQSSSPLPPKGFGDEFGEHQAETVDSAKETGQAVPAPTC